MYLFLIFHVIHPNVCIPGLRPHPSNHSPAWTAPARLMGAPHGAWTPLALGRPLGGSSVMRGCGFGVHRQSCGKALHLQCLYHRCSCAPIPISHRLEPLPARLSLSTSQEPPLSQERGLRPMALRQAATQFHIHACPRAMQKPRCTRRARRWEQRLQTCPSLIFFNSSKTNS